VNPRGLRIAAVLVAALTVIASSSAYYLLSTQAQQASSCALQNTNPLVVDQPEVPDSLDPAQVYTAPGWGIVQQVYQTLVMYNGSSYVDHEPLLAKNWSVSSDGFHWNFTLWPHEYFSNGDPINAYVVWYSFERTLVMNQAIAILADENFYAPNVSYYSPLPAIQASNATLSQMVNTFNTLANVTSPGAAVLSYMEAQNQSFRVINSSTLQVNLGFGYLGPIPYAFLLDQMAMPVFAAVDPLAVAAHGGVVPDLENSWMANDMVGSGPYNLTFWSPATGYSLQPNGNYWATAEAASLPWDNNLQPAKTAIDVSFQGDPAIITSNLETGTAATASFAFIGPSTISQLSHSHCLDVQALPVVYGSTTFSSWIYMDQQPALPGEPMNPFANWSVRAAVAHAINISQIIQVAFEGSASQWVGPVPPGYPYYDPDALSPYSYNLTLAKQFIADSPCRSGCGPINFDYIDSGDWSTVAQLLKADLSHIGITLSLTGLTPDGLVEEQVRNPATGDCISATSYAGGPFYAGIDYYTADYIAPDDATQANALSYGGFNVCMSEYANSTMDNLVVSAAGELNATIASQDYAQMTQLMYDNYTNVWLVIPTQYEVYNILLHGINLNPEGAVNPFQFEYNQDYAD
jgi:peptide/nickel transport system substrate-binding protein